MKAASFLLYEASLIPHGTSFGRVMEILKPTLQKKYFFIFYGDKQMITYYNR